MQVHLPGSHIAGRYEVASHPLIGGMGLVYLCFDHGEQRPVALKTFRPELLPDRPARDHFLREGSTWVALGRHSHIVRCYQVVRVGDGREVYLVLELVAREEGRADASLRSWLAPGRPLPVEQALLFALQVTWGMAHAVRVQPGLVHRDLKPENLLVGADKLLAGVNRLRITDFGLAHVIQGAAGAPVAVEGLAGIGSTQLTRGIVGTPLYMAPEQWQGQEVCLQTDVYALGCILFEMLAGQSTVEGSTQKAIELAHCMGHVRSLPADVPDVVREVVARCLAKDAAMRYHDWQVVSEALVGAYATVTHRAAPAPPGLQDIGDRQQIGGEGREDRVAAGWSYSAIGASYLDIGKAEMALGYFERARQVGRAEGEQRLEAAGLSSLGLAWTDLGNVRRAIGCYEQVLVVLKETGDRRGESVALGNLGSACLQLGDARRAVDWCEQALAIDREIGDWQAAGVDLSNLGLAFADLGDPWRAISCYEQALRLAHKTGDRRGEGNALGNLGLAYSALGDARRAAVCHEQYLAIAREIGDRRGEGNALGNLGNTHAALGDAVRAIDYYKQALAIALEIGDRQGEGNALSSQGNIYAALGDTGRAIGCYQQGLAIACEIGDRLGEATDLGNLGNVYGQIGDVRRSIEYHQQALKISREIGDIAKAARDSANLGMSLAHSGRIAEAIQLLEQAIFDLRQSGYPQQAQQAERMLAQVRGGHSAGSDPAPEHVLQQFDRLIGAVVAAARGDNQARSAVEATFARLERSHWCIAEPIQSIWAGERDEARLITGIDANSAVVVREILKRLRG